MQLYIINLIIRGLFQSKIIDFTICSHWKFKLWLHKWCIKVCWLSKKAFSWKCYTSILVLWLIWDCFALRYRAEIDGLRGLAVVPVILFHAGFEPFSGGFVGVDVFFVISGYLITTILIEDIENKRFSIVNFYERRARRLLPALFFVILVCIPFVWLWM